MARGQLAVAVLHRSLPPRWDSHCRHGQAVERAGFDGLLLANAMRGPISLSSSASYRPCDARSNARFEWVCPAGCARDQIALSSAVYVLGVQVTAATIEEANCSTGVIVLSGERLRTAVGIPGATQVAGS